MTYPKVLHLEELAGLVLPLFQLSANKCYISDSNMGSGKGFFQKYQILVLPYSC